MSTAVVEDSILPFNPVGEIGVLFSPCFSASLQSERRGAEGVHIAVVVTGLLDETARLGCSIGALRLHGGGRTGVVVAELLPDLNRVIFRFRGCIIRVPLLFPLRIAHGIGGLVCSLLLGSQTAPV